MEFECEVKVAVTVVGRPPKKSKKNAKITVFGISPWYTGKTVIFDIKTPFYSTYTTPRGEMMCPVDSSTPHVGGMETYWTHEVFGVSVCRPILSFLTPLPSAPGIFLIQKPYIGLQAKFSDDQVTISIPSAGVPILFHALEDPNKPWGRPSDTGLKRFR